LGQEEQGRVALNVTIEVLNYFENFFGQPFTLPKMDLIAIPDFSAGAMENWGMITFRLTALLYNSETDTAANLQRVATVVSHELAHQWTGDLVTTAWWSNLWLNEGFADFFETESINAIYPGWNLRDQFLVDDQQRAFYVDALLTTHPIIMNDTVTPDDINELFDTITYSKGGSILRMIQDYLGEQTFQSAYQTYISTYQFSNTFTPDFLNGNLKFIFVCKSEQLFNSNILLSM
jgi:aminopeptidase N